MRQYAELAAQYGAHDFEVDEVGQVSFQFETHPGEGWRRVVSCPPGEGDYYEACSRSTVADEIARVPCMSVLGLESVLGVQDFTVDSGDGFIHVPEVVTLDNATFVALPAVGDHAAPPSALVEIEADLYFAVRERCLDNVTRH